jgi:hypothetical protein
MSYSILAEHLTIAAFLDAQLLQIDRLIPTGSRREDPGPHQAKKA